MHKTNPSLSEPKWRPLDSFRAHRLPRDRAAWVLDKGSLTRLVLRHCHEAFRVKLRFQGWGKALPSERAVLGLGTASASLLREVTLCCGDQHWVSARTLIPATTLKGDGRRLAYLRERPLGEVLFADPGVRRGPMEVAQLRPDHVWFSAATRDLDPRPTELWARRTLFFLADRPLLVNEVFLPDLPEI